MKGCEYTAVEPLHKREDCSAPLQSDWLFEALGKPQGLADRAYCTLTGHLTTMGVGI